LIRHLSSVVCHPPEGEKIKVNITFEIPKWIERLLVWPLLIYRCRRYGYPFRIIPLTQGQYAIVDPDDYYRLSQHKWYAVRGGHSFYAGRGQWSKIQKKRLSIMMHAVILRPGRGRVADHINHNGLDNRRANLRIATPAQNARNCRQNKNGKSSKYRGVWHNKQNRKWRATIGYDYKRRQIGYFKKETDAAKAYDRAAKELHGEFASLNFPDK